MLSNSKYNIESILSDRYQLKELIYQGEFSIVYKGLDLKLKRDVAIKLIDSSLVNREFKTRFKREIDIMLKLDHPNIVPIYDYSIDDNSIYYVMKFIKGDSLKELNNKLNLDNKIAIFKELLRIFDYIHKNNIIHRDIKPSNIMIDYTGKIYLIDFGISKQNDNEITKLTQTKDFIGTVYYSSPEQIKGEKLGKESDIYSLGILLYEMISGNLPFEGTIQSIINSHLHVTPKEINLENDYKYIENICLKMIQKNPKDRYSDCNLILKEILNLNKSISAVNEDIPKLKINYKYLLTALLLGIVITALIYKKKQITQVYQILSNSNSEPKEENESKQVKPPSEISQKTETQNETENPKKEKQDKQEEPLSKKPENETKIETSTNATIQNQKLETMFTTRSVALRERSSNRSKQLNILPIGTEVKVSKTEIEEAISDNKNYFWYYSSDLDGYIYGKYLSTKKPKANQYTVLKYQPDQTYELSRDRIKLNKNDITLSYGNFTHGKYTGKYKVEKDLIILDYSNKKVSLCFKKKDTFETCTN
jgi:serine/threonine protein kinase